MEKVTVGVIGIGSFGKLHVKTYSEIDSVELVAISSRSVEKVQPFADKLNVRLYHDYHDLLANPDIQAVSICVPPHIQGEIAIKALEANKDVLLEKPIATKLEDALAIKEAAEKYNRTVMVGHIERFNPSLRRVKSLIKNGHIGRPFKVSSRRASTFKGKPEWVWDKCGMMIHICGHDLDVIKWFMDDHVEKVYAEGGSFLRNVPGQYDNLTILLRFKKGGIGVIESSWTMPSTFPTEENDTRIDVIGTEGNIIVNNLNQTISMCNEKKGLTYPGILRWPGGIDEDGGVNSYAIKDELLHFANCVRGKAKPTITIEEGIRILEILLAAGKSIEQQKPVYLD